MQHNRIIKLLKYGEVLALFRMLRPLAFVAPLAIWGTLDVSATEASKTSNVNVVVLDDKGGPVPGASIELKSGGNASTTATTDVSGKATLVVSTSTRYLLKVEKEGYLPTQTGLEIRQLSIAEVEVILSAAQLSEQSVEVKGEASSPVAESTTSDATLSPTKAEDTPLRPSTVVDALPLIPGIVRGPDGSVRIAGFGEDHSALLVNSVDATDPATGNFGLSVPIDSVQTVQVSEMPYLAEYGRFTAGVVAAETKRGGEKWAYSLNDPFPDFFIRSGHLDGVRDASPRFNFNGPIVPNRVYFLEGLEYLLNKQEVRTLPFAQSLSTSKAINSFTQFDAILSATQTLTASLHLAPHSQQYAGLDYFNPQPVTPNADFHETTGTVTDRLALAGGLLQSTLASRIVSSTITPQATADMILAPSGNLGNYFSQQSRSANRFQWIEQWTSHPFHAAGAHTFSIGSTLSHSENVGGFYARPVLVEDPAGHLLQRINFTGSGAFDLADTEPGIFVEDHWILNSQLAADVGVRLEGQTITHSARTAPRLGLLWTPDSGKTVIRGGIGVFYDSVPLDIYAFQSYPQQTITTYNSAGLPVGPPVQYVNLMAQEAQSSFPFIDRSYASGNFAPYSVAWNVGVEREISRMLLVRVKYLQSHEQDMLTLQPETIQTKNAFVLGASGWARTRQAEFTARIGAASNRQFFFSYVRQYAYGDIDAASTYLGNYPFPVVRGSLTASLPSEIPNRFLLWGHYAFSHKITVTPHLELRNGFPYQPTNVFQQYLATDGPQYRFPRYFSLDLRASKDVQVGPKHAVRFSGTLSNLTNHFNPLEVHSNVADSQYGAFFGNYGRRFVLDFDFLF